ncbi:hypothetical protein ACIRNI_27635 [Streptomyces sp. NPDC093546]|uniref:hypothetical protein n=1 Tax=Streptomyces sp. NPDC093546 TaxID=3366040 RepID=UPI00381CEF2C
MTTRIDTLISALGFFTGLMLLAGAVREYQAGSSGPGFVAAGLAIVLVSGVVLVRDLRRAQSAKRRT